MRNETALEMPAFDDAIGQFLTFLTNQCLSSTVYWIFREDVTWHSHRFFIKQPLPAENYTLVKTLYERGRNRGLGILIEVFCLIESQPYCYIWLPEDERDAELALVHGLKLSVPVKLMVAQPIYSRMLWQMHKWAGKRASAEVWLERLPQRDVS